MRISEDFLVEPTLKAHNLDRQHITIKDEGLTYGIYKKGDVLRHPSPIHKVDKCTKESMPDLFALQEEYAKRDKEKYWYNTLLKISGAQKRCDDNYCEKNQLLLKEQWIYFEISDITYNGFRDIMKKPLEHKRLLADIKRKVEERKRVLFQLQKLAYPKKQKAKGITRGR